MRTWRHVGEPIGAASAALVRTHPNRDATYFKRAVWVDSFEAKGRWFGEN